MHLLKSLLAGIAMAGLVLPAGAAHAQQSPYVSVSGSVFFDQNGNGTHDANEPTLSNVQIVVHGSSLPASTSARQSFENGRYDLQLMPGSYTVQAVLYDPYTGSAPGQPILASPSRAVTVAASTSQTGVDLGATLLPMPHDNRYFPETGYRIDDDLIWNYFNARGGVKTFGYPVSRTFPFLGFWEQIFQREIIQIGGQGGTTTRPVNLLDPGLLPVNSVNFSTFPPYDAAVAAAAPGPDTPNYGQAVLQYLQRTVPDSFAGQPVNFLQTFLSAANGSSGGYPPLVALEIYGFPTSNPAMDPNNHNFIYQRFQRGILHYDATLHVTQGILLADVFKEVLTGQNLPADVAQEVGSNPALAIYLDLYQPTQPNAVAQHPTHICAPTCTLEPRVSGTLAWLTPLSQASGASSNCLLEGSSSGLLPVTAT